jgi:IclR family transcriptional regulator, mhp operon transcriptional activator
MAERQQNGTLLRGLEVLRVLNESAPATLAQLHAATRLPKPTLIRLLDALCDTGYVLRGGKEGYLPSPKLQVLSAGADRDHRIVETALPLMNLLSQSIAWPSDLAVLNGEIMVIRATTRTSAPIRLAEPIVRSGLQVLRSELGIAHIAWCPKEERRRILQLIGSFGGASDETGRSPEAIERNLAAARRRGYALRSDCVEVRELDAFAIPVLVGERVVASMSVVFHGRAAPLRTIIDHCLPRLRWAAETAASALAVVA